MATRVSFCLSFFISSLFFQMIIVLHLHPISSFIIYIKKFHTLKCSHELRFYWQFILLLLFISFCFALHCFIHTENYFSILVCRRAVHIGIAPTKKATLTICPLNKPMLIWVLNKFQTVHCVHTTKISSSCNFNWNLLLLFFQLEWFMTTVNIK